MVRLEVQQSIFVRTLQKKKGTFVQEQDIFRWSGSTNVTSKTTDNVYTVDIRITIQSTTRIRAQLAACLCKPEGVRLEDLMIVLMIDPRIRGTVEIHGLPSSGMQKHDFVKFITGVQKQQTK